MELIAAAAFGLEGLVRKELNRLGIEARGENGGARFSKNGASWIFRFPFPSGWSAAKLPAVSGSMLSSSAGRRRWWRGC